MRLSLTLASVLAFLVAGGLSFGVAVLGAISIEQRSVAEMSFAMREDGHDWVEVAADGLKVQLTGTAPDEATRFRALSRAGAIVDPDRIVDHLGVVDPANIEAPRFTLEMLRNGDGISLIGLIPSATGRDAVADGIASVTSGVEVANMVETADYPTPPGWNAALRFSLQALTETPRAKISVAEGRVEVTAVTESAAERAALETFLTRNRPEGVELVMDISAPRPVITPFILRFVRSPEGNRLEACSAGTEASRTRILAAASAAGMPDDGSCDIGLGVPSPNWAAAVETALAAVRQFDTATITFSDADVALVAGAGTPQVLFDTVIGELDADLPEVFSLQAVLTPAPDREAEPAGPPNFIATRSPEGYVQLRGRLTDEQVEQAVLSYARSLFGRDNTYLATRLDPDLPEGWPVRVLAGIEGLSMLHNGSLTVEPDVLVLRGNTGSDDTVSNISRMLSEELGAAANFQIDVTYQETLDPEAALPTPEECVARINAVQETAKITFDPGSIEINDAAGEILDQLADLLPDCQHVEMEIGGHTDSQGRETMNLNLSQARADAVLNGLLARRVLTGNLTAQGYGEAQPIADNGTEEGREQNRRIEFRLMSEVAPEDPEPDPEAEAAVEETPPADDTATPDTTAEEATE